MEICSICLEETEAPSVSPSLSSLLQNPSLLRTSLIMLCSNLIMLRCHSRLQTQPRTNVPAYYNLFTLMVSYPPLAVLSTPCLMPYLAMPACCGALLWYLSLGSIPGCGSSAPHDAGMNAFHTFVKTPSLSSTFSSSECTASSLA